MSGYRNQGFMDGLLRGWSFVSDLQQRDKDNEFRQQEFGLRQRADDREQSDFDYRKDSRPDAALARQAGEAGLNDTIGAADYNTKDRATKTAGMKTPEQAALERDRGHADVLGGYQDNEGARAHNAWERGYKRETAPDPQLVRRAYGLDVEGKHLGNQKTLAEIDYTRRKGLQGSGGGGGFTFDEEGRLVQMPGYGKPVPAAVLKQATDAREGLRAAENMRTTLQSARELVSGGGRVFDYKQGKMVDAQPLKTGPVDRAYAYAANKSGLGTDANTRGLLRLKQIREKLRGDYLMLAKGVQTEGDAQRAMDAMMPDTNDPNALLMQIDALGKASENLARMHEESLWTIENSYGRTLRDSRNGLQGPGSGAAPGGQGGGKADPLGIR